MNSLSESRAKSPHGRNLLHICNDYGFSFRALKHLSEMNNIMNTVHARMSRAVEIDSNLGLLCELIMLRDNLFTFNPSYAALNKAEIETLINHMCTA